MIHDFEQDSDRTCFEHLGKHTPDSIRKAAKQELKHRGYSENCIKEVEYRKSRSY